MDKLIITGGNKLTGEIKVSGAKNVALKALVAACLTDEEVIIHNIPRISDFFVMADIIKDLGGTIRIEDHTAFVQLKDIKKPEVSLDKAADIRTSAMFLAPLLARVKMATIPNPGGCRIGARPIDRTIEGLKHMGVEITYDSSDGFFHAKTDKLQGVSYAFEKNTHTGTETMILAAVLASGKTILENAAQEPEVDDLIVFLNQMGAKIKRIEPRKITIDGVQKLNGAQFSIPPDRNEIVTLAIAAIITKGDVFIKDVTNVGLKEFLEKLKLVGGGIEEKENGIRFFYKEPLRTTDITTEIYPGFMTDWQSPWAVLMTQAAGASIIHETVFESRFGYVSELLKMGADIKMFNPEVKEPETFYNFNLTDDNKKNFHAAKIKGLTPLHNAVVHISDLRAGATLVLAALCAKGKSVIFGVERLDRGYEQFEVRLQSIGADIGRVSI